MRDSAGGGKTLFAMTFLGKSAADYAEPVATGLICAARLKL